MIRKAFSRRSMVCTSLVTALGLANAARAVDIVSGWDWIVTPPEGSDVRLNFLPVPPNSSKLVSLVSFPYSNSLSRTLWGEPRPGLPVKIEFTTTWVDPHGNQVGPESHHKVSQVTTTNQIVSGNFDTVIHRSTGLTGFTGIGTEGSVAIGVDWLSLKSPKPIWVPGGAIPGVADGYYDLYVGVNKTYAPTGPDTGWFRLRSDALDGSYGHINLGAVGDPVDTTRQFSDPASAWGLPLNWMAYIVPAGQDPSPASPFVTDFSIFHNSGWTPQYLVPEPSSWCLLALGALALAFKARSGKEVGPEWR